MRTGNTSSVEIWHHKCANIVCGKCNVASAKGVDFVSVDAVGQAGNCAGDAGAVDNHIGTQILREGFDALGVGNHQLLVGANNGAIVRGL